MGTISTAKGIHGLTASGATTSTNANGTLSLGVSQAQETLVGANVFYALSITSTGASDVATLDLTTGIVTQTAGTPTIADGDGKDFDGATLGVIADISAVHVLFDETAAGVIAMASTDTNLPDITALEDGHVNLTVIGAGKALTSGVVVFTFNDASSQKVTVTVAGVTA